MGQWSPGGKVGLAYAVQHDQVRFSLKHMCFKAPSHPGKEAYDAMECKAFKGWYPTWEASVRLPPSFLKLQSPPPLLPLPAYVTTMLCGPHGCTVRVVWTTSKSASVKKKKCAVGENSADHALFFF